MKTKIVKTNTINKQRALWLFVAFIIIMLLLSFRVGWHQIVKADEYNTMALSQQKDDASLTAERGDILDRNGKELGKNSLDYTVWASELYMTDTEARVELYDENLEKLGELIGADSEELKETLAKSPDQTIPISKGHTKEEGEAIEAAGIPGVSVSSESVRVYPLGNFASQIIGSVTDDGKGLSGIENEYNDILSGTDGRWVKETDNNGNELAFGTDMYYPSVAGSDVVLTIDQAIQYYAEDVVNRAYEEHDSEEISAIVMDVETGEILAAATAPSFDPNNSREPADPDELKTYNTLDSEEQMDYLNQMWSSPIFNDSYEPGSTFKLLTVAMALEEEEANLNSTFTCTGSTTVADATIHCTGNHGTQTLTEAVSNSCNPAMVTLATETGIEKFYNYLDLFGITELTGVDYPGETSSIMQAEEYAGPVGIATIGFGQGISTTPIQLLTAVASLGNDGNLMQPMLVKEIVNADGEVTEIEPNVVRKTVSEETANQVKEIMTGVVEEGTGSGAKIPGYEIGGKTATAEIVVDGEYTNEYVTSFISMVPMDDPQIAIMFINNQAKKGGTYSSTTAVKWAKELMENTIRYLDIEPSDSEAYESEEEKEMVKVPNLVGKSEEEAKKMLDAAGLKYNISPESIVGTNFTVKGQYPTSGESVEKGGTVYIYKD